jgi:iron complex outermembrane receptor protein
LKRALGLAALAALAFASPGSRAAEPAEKTFDLAAGDAATTLKQFVDQSGEQVVYMVDDVRGVRTNAVKGRDALDRMLANTALAAVQDRTTGALAVSRRPPVPSGGKAARPDPAPQAAAPAGDPEGPKEDIVRLSPFVVDRSRDRGYSTANEIGASRVNIPLDDVPTSVVVLNEEFLKDTAALTPDDAFRYVSGMNTTNLAYNGLVSVRGFVSQGLAYMDGLPANLVLDGASLGDFANVDRVEVIKGPNGVLYGSHVPGGVIDMITKKPLFGAATQLTLVAGSWDLHRAQIDATGPLGSGKNVAYRLVAMYQEGETDNHGPNDKKMIVPSFTWILGNKAQVTASFQYYNPDVGTSRTQWFDDAGGNVSFFLSPSRFYDDQDEHRTNWDYITNISYEQVVSDAWKFRLVFRNIDLSENKLNYTHGTFTFVSASGAALKNAAGANETSGNTTFAQAFADPLFADITMARQRQLNIIKAKHPALYFDLVGTFDTWDIHHVLLTSVQLNQDSTDTKTILWAYPTASVLHTVYNQDTQALATAQKVNTNNIAWDGDYSVGVQDNVSIWNNRVDAVAGVRRDNSPEHTYNRNTGASVNVTDAQNSYRAGLLAKLFGGLAAFGNWSQTFTPVVGYDAFNNPLKNQVATIKEAGFKEDAFKGRFTGTLSFFDIKQTNATQQVTVNPATGLTGSIQTGYIEGRGWEADVACQLSDSISLMAGAGNVSSKTDKGIPTRGVGQGFNGKIFGKYAFREGWAKGLSVGGGYDCNPRSPGDGAGSFYLPAYKVFDGFVSYEKARWRVQVNVANIGNELYAAGAVSGAYITAGLPRNYRFTATLSF